MAVVSGILVPTSTGNRLDVRRYVEAYLRQMDAPLRESTVFTPAGRSIVHQPGERVLYGPGGAPIRVIQLPAGGTQVEHGDHLHAHVRARTVTNRGTL